MVFLVPFLFMLLQHGARGDLFSALALATRPLRCFLDALVLALLFVTNAAHMFFLRHNDLQCFKINNACCSPGSLDSVALAYTFEL